MRSGLVLANVLRVSALGGLAMCAALLLIGCSPPPEERAPAIAASAPSQTTDPIARGREVFEQCGTCHALAAEDGAKIGPDLAQIIGRRIGAVDGYSYSTAFKNADIVWSPETLDAFLADPRDFLPGNRMAFSGVRDAADRAALVAFLQNQTSGP